MTAIPVALAQALHESQLLQPGAQAELPELQKRFPDPKALARALIQRGWLTAYQANLLLAGRCRELVIGPYRILDRLGEGGMGTVYKARHARMDRLVALKIIARDRLANPKAVQRFFREAKAAAQLSHPNIVLAYDADQAGDVQFFAMEYVEGTDLAKLVREQGPLPIDRACEYTRQAALGLQHAHERGVVHRDIKPSNLLVTQPQAGGPPVVKIGDFGLARLENETNPASRLTQLNTVVGTVDFIAPEQAENAGAADIRSDIYGLGCTLFCLLTGRPPFEGSDVVERTMARVLSEAPSVRSLRPEVPALLDQILTKMLARNPNDRYQSPMEVAMALEAFLKSGEPVPPPTGRVARKQGTSQPKPNEVARLSILATMPQRPRSATRGILLAGVVALILGAVGIAVFFVLTHLNGQAGASRPAETQVARVDNPSKHDPPDTEPKFSQQPGTKPEPKQDAKAEPATKPKATVEPAPQPKPESKPEPKENPKEQPKPEPKPEPKTDPQPKDTRIPVPDADAQAKAEKLIKDLFKVEYAKKKPPEMLMLSEKLLQQARETQDDVELAEAQLDGPAKQLAVDGEPDRRAARLRPCQDHFRDTGLALGPRPDGGVAVEVEGDGSVLFSGAWQTGERLGGEGGILRGDAEMAQGTSSGRNDPFDPWVAAVLVNRAEEGPRPDAENEELALLADGDGTVSGQLTGAQDRHAGN